MARDWTRAFWPATFKGFPFEVDVDEFEGGRRVSVAEVAYRDDPITEDFGGRAKRAFVTAYLASDFVDGASVGFAAILGSSGPGLLTLPLGIQGLYRCEHFRRVREKDRNGYIAFDLEFVTAGLSSVPFAAGAIVPRLSHLATAGRAALGATF